MNGLTRLFVSYSLALRGHLAHSHIGVCNGGSSSHTEDVQERTAANLLTKAFLILI